MATPPKKYPYAIYYSDGAYLTYDLLREDFECIKNVMLSSKAKPVAVTSVGILDLSQVRSVIELKEEPNKEEKAPPAANPDLSSEERQYLNLLSEQQKDMLGGLN